MLTRTGSDDMALLTDSDTLRKGLVARSDTDDTACLTDLRKRSDGGEKRAMTPSALPPRVLRGRFLKTKEGSSKGHSGGDSDTVSRPVTPTPGFGPRDDDGSMSDASMHSTVSTMTVTPMKRPSTVLYGESDAENPAGAVAKKKPAARRGRGARTPSSASVRPAAKTDLTSASEEEPCPGPSYRNALVGTARSSSTSPRPTINSLDRQELRSLADQCVVRLFNVAKTSNNLKGPYVRDIKEAAQTMSDIVEMLANRTASEELRRLWANNARLENENEHLRTELRALRRDFSERKKSPAREPAPATEPPLGISDMLGELQRALTLTMGEMINARIAGLEDRLLPAKRVRPPLQADLRREVEPVAGPSKPAAAQAAKKAPSKKDPGPKKGPAPAQAKKAPAQAKKAPVPPKKGSQSAKKAGPSATTSPPSSVTDEARGEAWTTVTRKGKKKKKPSSGAKQAQPDPSAGMVKKKEVKLTPPKSSAVSITLTPEATERGVTYQQVLEKAQSAIDLGQLGIGALKFRVTRTGARMFEVPGMQSGEKADLLAEKLQEVVGEVARVRRPVKTADLRITGLSDAVTPDRIASAVAEKGGCPTSAIKTMV
ncbi:unnamed protein product [Danaus chrysippus]|uniref:(African queen) hypothetical protein n=1 Tax=Danaus chrysippus TaxID=151541 RepID=A0A8J2W9U9_9NEOP|nr:unnamed protein product [Danaus chrysippus]